MKSLNVEDVLYRNIEINLLLGSKCNFIEKRSNVEIKDNIIVGVSAEKFILKRKGSEDIEMVENITLSNKKIKYIPFDLSNEMFQDFLLGKIIKIDRSDDYSLLELLKNGKENHIEIITGFYKDRKNRWYAMTPSFKMDADFLLRKCIFVQNHSHIDNTPVAAMSLTN